MMQEQSLVQRRHQNAQDSRFYKWCREGKLDKIEEFLRTCTGDLRMLSSRQGVFGYMPIHEAVSSGHTRVLQLLLEKGCNPNYRTNSGHTPLHLVASSGHIECARVLLEKNADVTIKDEYGKTPMETAKSNRKYGIVRLLQNAGEFIHVHNVIW